MLAINSWRKLKELSWSELMLLMQAFLLLPLVAFGIKFFGFRRFYGIMANFNDRKDRLQGREGIKQARTIAKLVEIASRYGLYKPNCLQKSLLLWWLLRRQGMESVLRIGVRKQQENLAAHAWVECQGCVLNDRSDVDRLFPPFAGAILPFEVKIL
ncbi:lasso peptide biosynthesis B2 protein [Phormidium sp. LEGE 05292]|uniref:lasso peptide biosynthesis B2 protein n=1 Tax=[Phormidium] sp. LEGE 05292 TaxID=767427 RepID=UPI00188301BE|nr:lasso peptide biosynthesis B2 protein [Phormidium sp. LEGE 05292]MBE9227079.1 lasso peptide biosynthesis B2 protein [Phormidium sp. LEGE 05292]